MVNREETLKEIDKAKKRHILYVILLILVFTAGVALLVIFTTRNELPALLMSIAAWVWCALLIYQIFKTRELVALMNTHISRLDDDRPPEDGGAADGAPRSEGGDCDEP